jgi:hypothetical protein
VLLRGGVVLALALGCAPALAQEARPRVTTVAALATYPNFFNGHRVRVRGEVTQAGEATFVAAGVHRVQAIGQIGAPEGTAARMDIAGTIFDVGRSQPDDPRLAGQPFQDISRARLNKDWPGIGELLILVVEEAEAAGGTTDATIRAIALDPERYADRRITVSGRFRGRNLFGDLPNAPGKTPHDFVLQSADAAVWVTGVRPRGEGFNLQVDSRLDTQRWLEVSGVVREERGLVLVQADRVAPGKEPASERGAGAGARPAPPPSPPPSIVFSAPNGGEADVPLSTTVRIQFSRDMKADTLKGRVRIGYSEAESAARNEPEPPPAPPFTMNYDAGKRVLTIAFSRPLERFRTLYVQLVEGIEAFDGQPLKPWTLTFQLGGS